MRTRQYMSLFVCKAERLIEVLGQAAAGIITSEQHEDQDHAPFNVESDLVGIARPKQELIDSILSEEKSLKVITVIGMGGLGKTTLVKTVFDDVDVRKNFHSCAWITFSQTFNVEDLCKDLIQQLCKNNSKRLTAPNLENMKRLALKMKVKDLLLKHKFLVVLDDVWSVCAWDSMKLIFPDNNCGSRIMVTTRISGIAFTACRFRDNIYELNPLSEDESWRLLLKNMCLDGCPTKWEHTLRSILKKCEGLPLGIATLGRVLRSEAMKARIDDWEISSSSYDVSVRIISKILLMSYDDLPPHLKCCFLYMSIFPESYHIEHSRLLRLWIAEGFVAPRGERRMEQIAEEYLIELLDRNLVQVAVTRSDRRVKSYQMHSLFREIIIGKSQEQNFTSVSKEGNGPLPKKVRRLSVHYTLQNTMPTQNLHSLRTLHMFEVKESVSKSSFPQLFLGGLKLLTVLDLQGANLEVFPATIAKLLNLRYLSLRDTRVKKIPSWIGKLHKLQTLDLKHTNVCKLPAEILDLKELRNLLVYCYSKSVDDESLKLHSKCGFKAPKGIGSLQALQKFSFVDADQAGGKIVKEIGKLTQLRRLGIIELKSGNDLCYSIEKLRNLQSLSVTAAKGNILDLHSLSSPPAHLRRLYLTGRLSSLPEWVPVLENLIKIILNSSELSEDPLKILQWKPNLVHFELIRAYNGKEMLFGRGMFKTLRFLGLQELDSLERVIVEDEAMQNLERLVIRGCKSLKVVPEGIKYLKKLTSLSLVNMPPELNARISPEGSDYHEVKHVPEVYSTNIVNGMRETQRLTPEGLTIDNDGGANARFHQLKNEGADSSEVKAEISIIQAEGEAKIKTDGPTEEITQIEDKC